MVLNEIKLYHHVFALSLSLKIAMDACLYNSVRLLSHLQRAQYFLVVLVYDLHKNLGLL